MRLTMPLIVGLDRSGTPDPKERKSSQELYVICFAGVEASLEELRAVLSVLRQECGLASGEEFRGRTCPEWVQNRLLEEGGKVGLCVAASIYEKAPAERGQSLPGAADFQSDAALALFDTFVRKHRLSGLWCDEDIEGRKQKAFETAASRIHRLAWPDTRLKVRHRPSKSSDLIQLADVVAYGLSRLLRDRVGEDALKRRLKALKSDPKNTIIGPLPWEI